MASDFREHLRNRDGTRKQHRMQGRHVRGKGFTHKMERKLCVWLNRQYGCRIDPDNRKSFVDTLSDGVILCKLVRDLSGNHKIRFTDPNAPSDGSSSGRRSTASPRRSTVSGGVYAMNENIQAFSRECRRRGIDSIVTVSPSDLRGGGNPGKVMACLMNLYRKSADWPGRLKMVLLKPTKSRAELVDDYLGTLKAVRRKSLLVSGGMTVAEVFNAERNGLESGPDHDLLTEAAETFPLVNATAELSAMLPSGGRPSALGDSSVDGMPGSNVAPASALMSVAGASSLLCMPTNVCHRSTVRILFSPCLLILCVCVLVEQITRSLQRYLRSNCS